MIHNGIIENFQVLRDRLDKEGHTLVSETDTECVAHLIESKLARRVPPSPTPCGPPSASSKARTHWSCAPSTSPTSW